MLGLVERPAAMFLVFTLLAGSLATVQAAEPLIFVSSFAGGAKGAIQAYRFNTSTGVLTPTAQTGEIQNPFFLALSPSGKHLYSIDAKAFGGKEDEEVAAYQIVDDNGALKLLNRQSARGAAACYLAVDASGKSVLVANYTSGSVASLPVKKDGSLGPAESFFQHAGVGDDDKPLTPHAHCFVISPDNRFAFAADLGLDQILCYQLDAGAARLTPSRPPFVSLPTGAGPRHFTFHPDGKHAYVVNERGNTVTLFDYAAETGTLKERQTLSTLPEDFDGKSYTADIKTTPNGKFLYATNRGHDSIAVYALADDGAMKLLEIEPSLGKGPQNLAITPDGQWLLCANMPGGNLVVFKIDDEGKLAPHGDPVSQLSPSCIMLLP